MPHTQPFYASNIYRLLYEKSLFPFFHAESIYRYCTLICIIDVDGMCIPSQDSDVNYVPCSGLRGENLVKPPTVRGLTDWYNGPTLLERIGEWEGGVPGQMDQCY